MGIIPRRVGRNVLRRIAISLSLAAGAVLALGGASASAAGIFQTTDGQPYTGPLIYTLVGNASSGVPGLGDVTCNESTVTADVTDAGSLVDSARAQVTALEISNNGSQACPDTIPTVDHVDTVTDDLPWAVAGDWLSDNTAGLANGTFTASGTRYTSSFTGGITCINVGNYNGTGATTRELQAAFYNPDNTASGQLEVRFEAAAVTTTTGSSPECPNSTFTATYQVTGANGAVLEMRGATPPVPNQTATATVVSGVVRIKLPGSDEFIVLDGPTEIPLGTIVDTTEGRVELVTAKDSQGGTRSAEFFDGVFEVDQEKGKGKKRKAGALTTVLKLVPKVGCGKAAVTGRGKGGNGLWGSENGGGHKTKGNKGSGSTRGTIWFVGDRCDGTTVGKVKEGKVLFRDFAKKKTIVLRKGDSYVAGK
jgi:hypothetical protein